MKKNMNRHLRFENEPTPPSPGVHIDECKKLGIKVVELEEMDNNSIGGCNDLQDCVLTIHHAYMHTFSNSMAVKIVENHLGNAMIISSNQGNG